MAEIKNFPNNVDEYIGAENVMKWLHGRSSGVFGADGNLSVTANGDMTVSVSDGVGWRTTKRTAQFFGMIQKNRLEASCS